jgi:hypothetical protein
VNNYATIGLWALAFLTSLAFFCFLDYLRERETEKQLKRRAEMKKKGMPPIYVDRWDR